MVTGTVWAWRTGVAQHPWHLRQPLWGLYQTERGEAMGVVNGVWQAWTRWARSQGLVPEWTAVGIGAVVAGVVVLLSMGWA